MRCANGRISSSFSFDLFFLWRNGFPVLMVLSFEIERFSIPSCVINAQIFAIGDKGASLSSTPLSLVKNSK